MQAAALQLRGVEAGRGAKGRGWKQSERMFGSRWSPWARSTACVSTVAGRGQVCVCVMQVGSDQVRVMLDRLARGMVE